MSTVANSDQVVQIYGGAGYLAEYDAERFFRDARIYRIFDGASEIHRSVIARALMKGNAGLFDPVAS